MAMEKVNPIRRPSKVKTALCTTPKPSRWFSANGLHFLLRNAPTRAESQRAVKDNTKTRPGKSTIVFIGDSGRRTGREGLMSCCSPQGILWLTACSREDYRLAMAGAEGSVTP